MKYKTRVNGEEVFFFDADDAKIVAKSACGEIAAKIASYLLKMKAIEETEGDVSKFLEAAESYKKVKEELETFCQKYRISELVKGDEQYIRLRDCTQDIIRSAYEEKDTMFFCRLCNGILFNY